MSEAPVIHMIWFGGSTLTMCGAKTDRYTRARCEPHNVTCRACLERALVKFSEGLADVRKQQVLSFECPTCEAGRGKACLSLAKRWQNPMSRTVGVMDNGYRKTPHPERVALVKAK